PRRWARPSALRRTARASARGGGTRGRCDRRGGASSWGSPSGQPRDARVRHGCALARLEIGDQRVHVLAPALALGAFLEKREAVSTLGEEAVHGDAIALRGLDGLAAEAH